MRFCYNQASYYSCDAENRKHGKGRRLFACEVMSKVVTLLSEMCVSFCKCMRVYVRLIEGAQHFQAEARVVILLRLGTFVCSFTKVEG